MARKYGSQRSLKERQADNKGVKDGTVRKGAGGRTMRRYNAKTGRWNVIKVIDKKGRTREAKKVSTRPDSPPTSPSRPTTRVSPSARGEGSARKPNKTTTYNPGGGTGRAKTPGDKFFDSIGRQIAVRGGNAAKTRGRNAIVKASNKKVVDREQAARKKREEALRAAAKARAEKMRKYG